MTGKKPDPDYAVFKDKDQLHHNWLITATLGTNAYSCLDTTSTGRIMYYELVREFQGRKFLLTTGTEANTALSNIHFGDKTDEKEAETDNDADKDTEKETTSMKVKWRLRNFNVHFFLN